MHPQHVAVRPPELGVRVHEPLDVVVPGGDIAQADDRRAEIRFVDDGRLARPQLLDIPAEERDAGAADLLARLAIARSGNHHVHASGDGTLVRGRGKRDFHAKRRLALRRELHRKRTERQQGTAQTSKKHSFHAGRYITNQTRPTCPTRLTCPSTDATFARPLPSMG